MQFGGGGGEGGEGGEGAQYAPPAPRSKSVPVSRAWVPMSRPVGDFLLAAPHFLPRPPHDPLAAQWKSNTLQRGRASYHMLPF